MMKSTLHKTIYLVLLTTLILFLTPLTTTHAAVLLKLNSSGSTVVTLQQRLAALNYTITNISTRYCCHTIQYSNLIDAVASLLFYF